MSARKKVRIASRSYVPGADGVATLLTAVSWVLQRLPGQVIEEQRGDLVPTLAEARDLVVEVAVAPKPTVRVRDGQRLLLAIPAAK